MNRKSASKKPKKQYTKESVKHSAAAAYHHGDLRRTLIDIASDIVKRDGADSLSLRGIAAEAGVSHMAPYSHFKSKKELIAAVTNRGFDQLAAAMEKAASIEDSNIKELKPKSQNARQLVLTYGTTYIEFAIRNPQLYRLMLGQVDPAAAQGQRQKCTNDNKETTINTGAKRPFALLHEAFLTTPSNKEQAKNQALGCWSLVHGLAALVIDGRIDIPDGVSTKAFLSTITPQL